MALKKMRGKKPAKNELAVVIGAGRSGLAASELLASKGAKVRLLDQNPDAISQEQKDRLLSLGIEWLPGEHMPEYFEKAAFVIPSPGMPIASLSKILPANQEGMEIISEMELAWRYLEDEPVLAVTGTSGKTTTASIAAAMLKAQGYAVFLGGNIGTPLSEYILDSRKADVIVLEVSSFQLQGCSTFCPRAAILLNLSPNHLDYHKDMQEYTEAKFRIFRCQDENDLAILGQDLKGYAEIENIKSRKVWITAQNNFPDMKLLGRHNSLNAEAAWQGARLFGVSLDNARKALQVFSPLPDRLETVAEINGATYINDSKCTTVSALKVALEAMDRPVRLLCGGKFKGGDLHELNGLVSEKVKEVALFGGGAEHFENAWQGLVPLSWQPTLEEAVKKLATHASAGDVILLAPATASFDQYKNYMARGADFKRIVGKM